MLPRNFSVLIEGEPSAGMFEVCCYLGSCHLKAGERLVFVEASISPDMVRRQMALFGIEAFDYEEMGQLSIVDAYSPAEVESVSPYEIRVRDLGNLEEILERVEEGIVAVGGAPVKVVLHSITPFYGRNEPSQVTRFFKALSSMVKMSGVLLCAAHKRVIDNMHIAALESVADGVLEMMIDGRFRRFVRMRWFKGLQVVPEWVPFDFEREEELGGTSLLWRRE